MAQDLYEPATRPAWWSQSRNRLWTLVLMAVVAIAAFMTLGVDADWAFVLEHRGTKVITMMVVACALGMSTVVFQTVTHNTILTPAVMGLDALYLFLQAVLVLVLGSVGVVGLGVIPKFGLEIVLMVVLSVDFPFFGGAVTGGHGHGHSVSQHDQLCHAHDRPQ